MVVDGVGKLIRLSDSLWTVRKADDIRRRRVVDDAGEEQGIVEELFVDEAENKVRLLQVSPPAIFGVIRCGWFISTDAITLISSNSVRLDIYGQNAYERVRYDPDVVRRASRAMDLLNDYRCI
jgi:sporulation protein YlmC with PRC-barrel domain